MLADVPVFGVCGHKDSGKSTLIEAFLPRLLAKGLRVAVAKPHAHGIEVDRPGKDSDRFFRLGADVFLEGEGQGFSRTHPRRRRPFQRGQGDPRPARRLGDLARHYDLVLVEGRRGVDCAKVWVLGKGEGSPPPEAGDVLAALPHNSGGIEAAWRILQRWLPRQWLKTPVRGCVLIGGPSSRMGGRPKHLLRTAGRTWLERAVPLLGSVTNREVVIAGSGAVPQGLTDVVRLPDVPDAEGPMAGLLSAMRWAPDASWLVAACDMPNVSAEALGWLLSTRSPGVWATLPRLPGRPGVEPLLAHYDFRARALVEDLAAKGRFSLSRLADHPKVITPAPRSDLLASWENVNTPADLAQGRPQEEATWEPPAL